MTYKIHCPGCNGETSEIARGYAEAGKCPRCGLSNDVLEEIWRVRAGHATAEVKEQYEQMTVRAGKAEAEVQRLTRKLNAIRDALESDHD